MRAKSKSRTGRFFATLTIAPVALAAWSAMNGCSDDSFGTTAENDAASDVSTSDVVANDAAAADVVVVPFDGGACDLSKPFGSLIAIPELAAPLTQRQTARLTHDELTIYFQQQAIVDSGITTTTDGGDGGADAGPGPVFQLMTASRASIGDVWGIATPVSGLTNPSANETDPSVTADNDTLYFGSSMTGSKGGSDLWISTRTTPTASFSAPSNLATLNSVNDESQPYVMPDGLALYFRTKIVGGNFDLAYATRSSTGSFALFTSTDIFQNVNTTSIESLPTATFDELTLYFATDRAAPGAGGRQIWKATRASKSAAFGTPTAVIELNTINFVEPSWVSDDGCRLYVTAGTAGMLQLYVTNKPAN